MRKKFINDISANTLQVIVVQCCGLVIFYLLSTGLDKNEFGEINWVLAVLLTAFGILALGIDQVSIKRIAAGNDARQVLSAYLFHVLISGLFFYFLLGAGYLLFPSFFAKHGLLLLLGIGKLMIFFSIPFKQLATGLEKFKQLLFMAICSNVIRSIALIILASTGHIDFKVVIIVFVAGDFAELLLCIFIVQFIIKIPVTIKWDKPHYISLLKESFPQSGVAVFSAALARFDWIFLGLLASNIILANYSFAYKVFEMATLPMLVIAPVLIPRFTKLFHPEANNLPAAKKADLFVLLRWEMIIASLTALVLNILWVPAIDLLTQNKYGLINRHTILILSASMPFLYFNNFLWTINFASNRLKMIFYVFLVSFLLNVAGDIALIPFFGAEGAAVAYLFAIIVQSLLYLRRTKLEGLKQNCFSVLICPALAILSSLLATLIFNSIYLVLFSSLLMYFSSLYFSRQISRNDLQVIKRIAGF